MKMGFGYGYSRSKHTSAGGGPAAPVNSVAPVVTGASGLGSTYSCTTGTWSGSPSFAYQWKWENNAAISGATSANYVSVEADIGHTPKCTVTATNAGGSVAADSNLGNIVLSPDVDLLAGTVASRRTLLAAAGYAFTRTGTALQANWDGTFTSAATNEARMAAAATEGMWWGKSWTNNCARSCDLSNAAWTISGALASRTYNATAAGDLPMTLLDAGATTNYHALYCPSGITNNAGTYIDGMWVRAGTGRYVGLRGPKLDGASLYGFSVFDTTNGTSTNVGTGVTSGMIDFGGSPKLWLCWMKNPVSTGNANNEDILPFLHNASTFAGGSFTPPSFAGGNLTMNIGGCYRVAGAQIMLDPIVTAGSAVTRGVEACTASISNLPAAFAWRMQAKSYQAPPHGVANYPSPVSINGTGENYPYLTDSQNVNVYHAQPTPSHSKDDTHSVTHPLTFKVASRVKTADTSSSVNGVAEKTPDASASAPGTHTTVTVGNANGGGQFLGALKSLPHPASWYPATKSLSVLSA